MSIAFLDPTFPARLPSRNETLDFNVVDTDPEALVVSLRFADASMETIFQAGLVGRVYTVTRDGTDNRSFHVKRMGGWPAGQFQFAITEAGASSGVDMVTAVLNLTTGNNYDRVVTPAIDTVGALVFHIVSGSVFNGLAAPSDQTVAHHLRLISDSNFAVSVPHEDAGNTAATSRFYNSNTPTTITWQPYATRDVVWVPASLSSHGLSRWYIY